MKSFRFGWLRGASTPEPWQLRALDHLRSEPGVECVSELGHAEATLQAAELGLQAVLEFQHSGHPMVLKLREVLPLGVWSFALDNEPLGLAEVSRREPTIGAALVQRRQSDGGVVTEKLVEGVFPVRRHSLKATRRRVLGQLETWPALAVRRIRALHSPDAPGAVAYPGPRVAATETGGRDGPAASAAPRRSDRWRLRWSESVGLWGRLREELIEQRWSIGIIESSLEEWLGPRLRNASPSSIPSIVPPRSMRWLPASRPGCFLADPIAFAHDGKTVVLAESFDYHRARGHIVLVGGIHGGEPQDARDLIRSWAHLSYPYVFAHEGVIWCVPESSEARRAVLLRADPFPDHWVEEAVLIDDVPAVDSTLFEHDGRWWLLCGRADADDRTHVFGWSAPRLQGPWKPHPWNPLRSDVRSSRPAGPPFRIDGRLFRPTQDCARTYGGAVTINEILELTPVSFHEESRLRIVPDPEGPYPDGLHTLSSAGSFTVVDGKRHTLSLRRLWADAVSRGSARRCASHASLLEPAATPQ